MVWKLKRYIGPLINRLNADVEYTPHDTVVASDRTPDTQWKLWKKFAEEFESSYKKDTTLFNSVDLRNYVIKSIKKKRPKKGSGT